MAPDMVAEADVATDTEVMASVERAEDDTFIIADISADGAYLTVPLDDAASLPEWR